MEYLQDLGILDSVKNACYLFLGLVIGYAFWEFCENRAKRGIESVKVWLFVIMLVWGASGFFFLPYIKYPIAQLFYYAVPEWDIPLTMWTKWEFLQHRSWLFSSVLIPLTFLSIFIIVSRFCKRFIGFLLSFIRDIGIGLSIGMSAHILGDFLLPWIPSGDTDIRIFGWSYFYSLIWLVLNLFVGLSIPFFVIRKSS